MFDEPEIKLFTDRQNGNMKNADTREHTRENNPNFRSLLIALPLTDSDGGFLAARNQKYCRFEISTFRARTSSLLQFCNFRGYTLDMTVYNLVKCACKKNKNLQKTLKAENLKSVNLWRRVTMTPCSCWLGCNIYNLLSLGNLLLYKTFDSLNISSMIQHSTV